MPTISLLFDIPIPYSSLGSLIPELFHGNSRETVDEETVSNNDFGKLFTEIKVNGIFFFVYNSNGVLVMKITKMA